MKFINSFYGELLKVRGSALLWLTIAGSLIIPITFIVRNLIFGYHINLFDGTGAWMDQFLKVSKPFIGFILPIGIILICSLIAQVEYKNNNWKQVHTTPQSYTTIFLAKYAALMFLAGIVFVLLNFGILLLGIIPTLFLDGSFPNESIPFAQLFEETFKCFIVSLPILGIQYLISLRFKNFMVSVGVGLALFVGTILVISVSGSFLSPYSYAFYYVNDEMNDFSNKFYLYAVIYFFLLSGVNYVLYLTKKEKG
ncbi:MAG: hypothetical protein ACI837_003560 [Crocinitomicaceae bacterium]|jgi:hypothetical protein